MPVANSGQSLPGDQEQISFDVARAILIDALATAPLSTPPTKEEIERRDDTEVEALIQIGAFMVDRWSTETVASRGLSGPQAVRAAAKAASSCSGLHFRTITDEAHRKLRGFQDRHREVMPASIVRAELKPLALNVAGELDQDRPRWEQPLHWLWFLLEGLKGFVGLLGVILICAAISLFAALLVPRFRTEVLNGVSTIFGGDQARNSHLPDSQNALDLGTVGVNQQ